MTIWLRDGSFPEILNYLPDGGQFSWVPVLIQIQVIYDFVAEGWIYRIFHDIFRLIHIWMIHMSGDDLWDSEIYPSLFSCYMLWCWHGGHVFEMLIFLFVPIMWTNDVTEQAYIPIEKIIRTSKQSASTSWQCNTSGNHHQPATYGDFCLKCVSPC